MPIEPRIQWYRALYSKLLSGYPRAYRQRYGEGLEQTFTDMCQERVKEGGPLGSLVLWLLLETSAAIVRENAKMMMTGIIQRGSTIFLRLVITLIATAALAICIFPLPRMIAKEAAKTPDTAWQIYMFLAGAYVQAAFFLYALFQGFRLLGLIDHNRTFSEPSVRALGQIKRSAIAIGLLMVMGVLWVMFLSAGSGEDSAGPVMVGFIGALVSSVVAAATAVVQTQVQNAIDTTRARQE